MKYLASTLILTLILLSSCKNDLYKEVEILKAESHSLSVKENQSPIGLDRSYWYAGKAEVSKYELSQNRYRDVHEGEVVMIFVTEDFLTDKQVKNDNYVNQNSTPILKTNQLRRFTTGVYDYSMMTSVFTRADGSMTEKITLGSQDWCGHSFVQVNNKDNGYHMLIRSYFESEGDQEFVTKADLLEDELFNLIRISPSLVKEGSFKILPSLNYLRLTHRKMEGIDATITKTTGSQNTVSISYPSLSREVAITYEPTSPYKIISFEESYPSMFDKKQRTSKATKVSELYEAYWGMNKANDKNKRADLRISGFD